MPPEALDDLPFLTNACAIGVDGALTSTADIFRRVDDLSEPPSAGRSAARRLDGRGPVRRPRPRMNACWESPWASFAAVARKQGVPVDLLDDVVQETLITIHRVRQTYDPSRSYHAWLAAIAARRAIDALRQHGRRDRREVHEPLHGGKPSGGASGRRGHRARPARCDAALGRGDACHRVSARRWNISACASARWPRRPSSPDALPAP